MNLDIEILRLTLGQLVLDSIALQSQIKALQEQPKEPPKEPRADDPPK